MVLLVTCFGGSQFLEPRLLFALHKAEYFFTRHISALLDESALFGGCCTVGTPVVKTFVFFCFFLLFITPKSR